MLIQEHCNEHRMRILMLIQEHCDKHRMRRHKENDVRIVLGQGKNLFDVVLDLKFQE